MMIDFALEAERKQGMSPRDAIVQASLLRFRPIMMTTLAALFGAMPLALEQRHRLGAAQSARHHHHRRPAAEPVAHALHDAGDLSRDGAAQGAPEPAASRCRPSSTCRRSRNLRSAPRSEAMNFPILRTLHSPAGRHDPAGDRPVSGRRGRLPLPAGVEHADGRFPDHPRLREPAGRRSGDHGGDRRRAARAPARRDRRRHRDHLASSLGNTRITIQFDLTRNIDGAARDVQAAINAALTDLPGDLQTLPAMRKVQSRRRRRS